MYSAAKLDALLTVAKRNGILCIADEVMTGFGRTGGPTLFASGHLAVSPDLICLSKGITGGVLPLGATFCTQQVATTFTKEGKSFLHGHSFTGNPIACAAANASLDLLEHETCHRQRKMITEQHALFAKTIEGRPGIKEVRQQGTILAIELLSNEASGYMNPLRERIYHYFINKNILLRPLGNVIYVLPPYCITAEQLTVVYHEITHFLKGL